MHSETNFTTGKILSPLLRFMLPVFFAMFLQSMYGAVDLMIVGKFAEARDVSAVSTGSQIMMTLTNLINSFAMGTTILLGRRIGDGRLRRPEYRREQIRPRKKSAAVRDRRIGSAGCGHVCGHLFLRQPPLGHLRK